jgi:hypothetical protein
MALPTNLDQLNRTSFSEVNSKPAKRVDVVSTATLFAVVNTGNPGQASVVIDTGTNFIGLATVTVGNLVNSLSTINSPVTVIQGTTPWSSLGTMTVGASLPVGTNYIGLASVNVGGTLPALTVGTATIGIVRVANQNALIAGSAYVGLASVNIGGTLPALTAGTAYIGLASVNIGGTLPALSAGSAFIGLTTTVVGSAATLFAVVNTGASNSNITLNPSPNFIGLATVVIGSGATIFAVVNTAAAGEASIAFDPTPILNTSAKNAAWVSTATGSLLNVNLTGRDGSVAKVETTGALDVLGLAGTNYIGLASVNIGGTLPALTAGSAFIGLTTAVIGSAATIFAVVNTAAAGEASIALDPSPILNTSLKTAAWVSTATGSMLNTALMGRGGTVANIETSGALDVLNVAGTSYIGLASVNIGGTLPALVAGTAYVGLASVNIGGTLPALTVGTATIGIVRVANQNALVAGTAYVGLASVNIGGTLPALTTGTAFIGLATVVNGAGSAFIGLATVVVGSNVTTYQVPISTYTAINSIYSASGAATLFLPPSGQRWVLKDVIVGSLGKSEVNISSATNVVIPYMSLATQSGYIGNFGDSGVRAKAVDQALVINLNGAATISVMTNVRFE